MLSFLKRNFDGLLMFFWLTLILIINVATIDSSAGLQHTPNTIVYIIVGLLFITFCSVGVQVSRNKHH